MKVWDTLMVRDEMDLLECRFYELDGLVDRWVIVEAGVDHQGHPKPFHFLDNAERFGPWADRILYMPVQSLPEAPDPWVREHAQREMIRMGLADAAPDDLVLHQDMDEIPTADSLRRAIDRITSGVTDAVTFIQRVSVFAVDWELPYPWVGDVPCLVRKAMIGNMVGLRHQSQGFYRIKDAGWHLTWLGGPDAIRSKIKSYCHTEMDEYILRGLAEQKFYERGIFWGNCGHPETQLKAVDVDSHWPRWISERRCPLTWFRPRGAEG